MDTLEAPKDNSISKFVAVCAQRIALPKGALVLDIPCGFGRHAHWFAQNHYRVVGADLDGIRIAAARENAPSSPCAIRWIVADIEQRLPIERGTFDLVVIVHYFSETVISQALEALRPGGWLILETFGGQGKNWMALPPLGWAAGRFCNEFQVSVLEERAVGPSKSNAAVRLMAKYRR
jgi:SAM-dependent methyltransferase